MFSDDEVRKETIKIMTACGWSYFTCSSSDRSFYEMHARLNLGYRQRRAREQVKERVD